MGNFQRERKVYKTKTFELMWQYVHFVSTRKNRAPATYKVRCYIKDIKMGKIWCLLSKNTQSRGGKESKKLSAIKI